MRSIMICTPPSSSGDKIEKNEMGGACSGYCGEEWHNSVLVGKPEGKRSLVRSRCRWNFQEVGCDVMD